MKALRFNQFLLVVVTAAVALVLGTVWGGQTSVGTRGLSGGAHAGHRPAHLLGGDLKAAAVTPGKVRNYFIAADEVLWDYAPSGSNQITGQPFTDDENVFVQNGPTRIGDTYRKALYRGYTDATFRTRIPADPNLGMLGPVIRAEVGDTIKVVFKNNTSIPASMHPHGVFYTKSSEGAPYADGTNGAAKADDAVPPGGHRHLHLGGPRARRTRPDGRELGAVDVPLAHRRDRRHQRRPGRPDGDHPEGLGQARRQPDRRGPRGVLVLLGGQREREPVPRPEPRRDRPGSPRGGPGRRGSLRGEQPDALHQRLRLRQRPDDRPPQGRARPVVPLLAGHRGRPAHSPLARQHRHGDGDADRHGRRSCRAT